MSDPGRVTPTNPPSMAVLIEGDRLALKDAHHLQNRTDVVYRRLFHLEDSTVGDDAFAFRKGLRIVSYPHFYAYPDEDAYLLGWRIWRQIRRDRWFNPEEDAVRMAGIEERILNWKG